MDDFTYGAGVAAITIVAVLVFLLSVNGMDLLARDHRIFDSIAQECEEKGFIQNHQIRIMCEVEK